MHNQHYDETLEVSDGEEIASTTATPRDMERGQFNRHILEGVWGYYDPKAQVGLKFEY